MTVIHVSRALRATAAAAFIFASAGAAMAQGAADPVIAKVNGAEIRQSDLALAAEDIGSNLPAEASAQAKREYLITYLSDMILLAQDAEMQGMSSSDEFKRRFAMMRNKVLMELDLQQTGKKAAADPAAMRKVYDEAVKGMTQEEEVRARHILVESEDAAKAILADLKKGTDFAELAKQKSKDPGAADGGDLGYFTKDQMVPEFSEAAFKLDKGKVSDPVKSQFGWHIIKVEDKRKKPVPTFEQVKDQLETYVMRKAQTDLVARLRQRAKIERLDGGPPPAPAAATPAPAAP
jgi:peptidyl-prolyl cis-trans isomerase C